MQGRGKVPLVWLPLNARCKRNLDPRIQSQMAITAGANSASLHMAEVMRFPYVDINRVFGEGARSVTEYDERVCNVTADGIHLPQAVDHLRAHYLLSQFCDERGQLRRVPQHFRPSQARCPR